MPQRILTVIDQGQAQQHLLNHNQALFDVPKLAAKVKQLEVLHRAMGRQLDDLRSSYDLGWFQTQEQMRQEGH